MLIHSCKFFLLLRLSYRVFIHLFQFMVIIKLFLPVFLRILVVFIDQLRHHFLILPFHALLLITLPYRYQLHGILASFMFLLLLNNLSHRLFLSLVVIGPDIGNNAVRMLSLVLIPFIILLFFDCNLLRQIIVVFRVLASLAGCHIYRLFPF